MTLRDLVGPSPRCPSCGEGVTEFDAEQFCLALECESVVGDAEQPEPPDIVRDVLVPMWPAVVYALLSPLVLPWTLGPSFLELELHQQVYSVLGPIVILLSMFHAARRVENVH